MFLVDIDFKRSVYVLFHVVLTNAKRREIRLYMNMEKALKLAELLHNEIPFLASIKTREEYAFAIKILEKCKL